MIFTKNMIFIAKITQRKNLTEKWCEMGFVFPTFATKTCVEKCFLLYLKKNTNHISHHFSVRFFSMDGSIQNISRGRSAQSVSWLSAIGNFGVSWYMDDPISILIKFHIFQHLYSWVLSHLIYHSIVWIFVCQVISNFFTFKILSY